MPIIWRVRTDGSVNNGGGYSDGGTDYSQQAAPQLTVSDAASSSTTNLNSVTGGFTSAMIGNVVNVIGQGRRLIVAFVDTNNVTCDVAWGTFSGATANVGGGLSGPEDGNLSYAPNDIVYIEGGIYNSTSPRPVIADGSAANGWISFIGNTSGSLASDCDIEESNMPVFVCPSSSVPIFLLNAASRLRFRNIKTRHTASTRGTGWSSASGASRGIQWINCISEGCANGWYQPTNVHGSHWINCISVSGTYGWRCAAGSEGLAWNGCIAAANAGPGWRLEGDQYYVLKNCVAANNSGANSHGIHFPNAATDQNSWSIIDHFVAYNNVGNGIRFDATVGTNRGVYIQNCIFDSNTAYGISCATTGVLQVVGPIYANSNAFYNNGSGIRFNVATGINEITLSASPFSNPGALNFILNDTSSADDCRNAGWPKYIGATGSLTTNYVDVGASQSLVTASVVSNNNLTLHPGLNGGIRG